MSFLHVCSRGSPDAKFVNPSPERLTEAIYQLDGSKCINVILTTSKGYLFIYSSTANRMHIEYSGTGMAHVVNAHLVDETQSASQLLNFPLDNGTADDWSIQETVSRETAVEVAVHFLQYNTFPNSLTWEGNMGDFV